MRAYKTMSYPNLGRSGEQYTGICSVQHISVSNLQLRWLHRTDIKTPFALRSPALASSVGCNGGVGRSRPVGWINAGDFLLTPVGEKSLHFSCKSFWEKRSFTIIEQMIVACYLCNIFTTQQLSSDKLCL